MENENRLSKILAAAGVASRRAAEQMIFEGRVMVNGSICRIPQTKVCLSSDAIVVDGELVKNEEKKVYYILNKPKGYTCTALRPGKKKIVLDLFANSDERLFTVGRLDRDTSGLLLVTNDGHFANKVIHPSSNITKEYIVKTTSEISDEHLKKINKGAYVEGTFVRPSSVAKIRKGTLRVCVKEGKKREVRTLVENGGLKIIELKRVRIGGLRLGLLPLGKYRPMSTEEKRILFS
jgi:23S rRNA pseudouridine2605 synthase